MSDDHFAYRPFSPGRAADLGSESPPAGAAVAEIAAIAWSPTGDETPALLDRALDEALSAETAGTFSEALADFDAVLAAELLIETGIAHRAVARIENGVLTVGFEPIDLKRGPR